MKHQRYRYVAGAAGLIMLMHDLRAQASAKSLLNEFAIQSIPIIPNQIVKAGPKESIHRTIRDCRVWRVF